MTIKLNRRTFLAVLGTVSAAAATGVSRGVKLRAKTAHDFVNIHFFTETPPEPTVHPRSAAINYLSST